MNMMYRAAACALAISLFLPLCARAEAKPAISGAVQTLLKAGGVPGASVAIMKHGAIVFEQGFGVKNLDRQTPVGIHTRFEIGSITKQFTAAAILQLKERGKLSLSDPLGKYVPQYAAAKNVTVEELLWQVSGVPDYTEVPHFLHIATAQRGSLGAVLALVKGEPLRFAPGSKWEYSNTNYYLLGRVVEIASGMPWQQYVRTHIFQPAGMTESTFMEDERGVRDMATGYMVDKGKTEPSPPFGGWAYSAGAIVSTAADLLKWDRALFGGKIVSVGDVRTMTQPGRLRNGKPTKYGFGWVVSSHDGTPQIWHNGGTFGFSAENEVYPSLGQAIVVLENTSDGSPEVVSSRVFAALNPALAKVEMQNAAGEDPAVTARVKNTWEMLLSGAVDRSQFTAQFNKELTPEVLSGAAAQFKTLGSAQSWVYRGKKNTGGATVYVYLVTFSSGAKLRVTMGVEKDGKIGVYDASPG